MITRREFLKKSFAAAAGSAVPFLGGVRRERPYAAADLTILYTNDTHARLDPFPENATEFAGLGGIARRASLVRKIRSEEKNVLLLDAGDVFQGTPWFDVYGGRVDLELMTEMNYDAMAIGNHEFDRGLDGLAEAAQKAGFPMLAANYQVRNTPINPYVDRYIIKEFEGFTVGIFGLGIDLEGVVKNPALYGDVRHGNPEIWAGSMVNMLRNTRNCDFIICLSHLGYRYDGNPGRIDDVTLASRVAGIDLIIGGHTHTFLDDPVPVTNPEETTTWITQMGHSGVRLGRLDLQWSSQTEMTDSYYTIGG